MNSGQYWDNKIIEWENSINNQGKVSFIESIAALFRHPLKVRRDWCLSLAKKISKNKKIVEMGCGSGFFAFKLLKEGSPKHITGIDISQNAIDRANKISKDLKISNKAKFIVGDVDGMKLPDADLYLGLGFLDYLNDEEIKDLFEKMKGKQFIFTFSEKRFSILRLMHIIYLNIQKCPKHYYYTKKHLRELVGSNHSNVRIISDSSMSFGCIIHNLPLPNNFNN